MGGLGLLEGEEFGFAVVRAVRNAVMFGSPPQDAAPRSASGCAAAHGPPHLALHSRGDSGALRHRQHLPP